MERTNLFIQTTPDLFQDAPESVVETELKVEQIMVRRERQTFMRLRKSNAVLFTVRSYIRPLTDLGVEEARALKSQLLGWEEEVRAYKGFGIWGTVTINYCDAMTRDNDAQVGGEW